MKKQKIKYKLESFIIFLNILRSLKREKGHNFKYIFFKNKLK